MSDEALLQLARVSGLMAEWKDAAGRPMTVAPDALRALLGALGLPADSDAQIAESLAAQRHALHATLPPLVTTEAGRELRLDIPPGRYRVEAEDGTAAEGIATPASRGARITAPTLPGYYVVEGGARQLILAVAPPHAHRIIDACPEGRAWGLSAQLYSLRRASNQGVGDYAALETLATSAAALGADAIAISPVHAQFSADPSRFSPYAPSSRARLDVRHAEPGDVMGQPYELPEPVAHRLAELEALPLIDWPAVTEVRLAVLRDLFDAFPNAPQSSRDAFAAFRAEGGAPLQRHALFEALHAAQFQADPLRWHWRDWPAELRDPESPGVAAFAAQHAREVEFHAFLQWLAERGLASAQRAAKASGMRIGLIADLAIGVDDGGSDAWGRQADMLQRVEIGAPPDLFNARGQGWGITSFSPHGLQASGFAGFREMLTAALRHAGGVRLDHVLGLRRLWLVPHGASPKDGAYLRYPLEDLLRLVALESWRHKGIVIGEDLGTVPAGFRPRLEKAGLAGMRVLWFERSGERFTAPAYWTEGAVAMTSTHDLPTVAGWWTGHDLTWRRKLGLHPVESATARQAERNALWEAFKASGTAQGRVPSRASGTAAAQAAAAHIGRAACHLSLLPLEDAVAAIEQPNLPGTTHEHPNWRRRFEMPVDLMLAEPAVEQRLRGLARARRAD
ncbi:4-alpha-glucanotransferase [Acetobacteraceae bacterium AT-5844]|nr:4-alpha-glucanotransferase [Acetobacteraceae bacterium AT-5844]